MTQLMDQPTEVTPAGTARWHPTDRFVLRLTGLPIETARDLRFPSTTRWADEVLDGEASLTHRAVGLSDRLHDHIRTYAGSPHRSALIGLRRHIFNNRLPRDPESVATMLADCPPDLAGDVADWLSDRQAHEVRIGCGAAIAGAETEERRGVLRRAATDRRFREGLLLASASLDTYLDRYLETGVPLTKRGRRVERSLLEYLYRTACKTSPFSTFTGVAIGRLDDDADNLLVGTVDDHWRSHVRVNVAVLSRLITATIDNPTILARLSAQLTPGWSMDLERVRFVRRTVTRGDDDAAVSFDTVRDSLFFLQRNGTLREILAILELTGRMPFVELIQRLDELTGDGPERCTQYLRMLVRVGLLWIPDLQIDVHAADPLDAFIASLRAVDQDWADAVAAHLATVADLLRVYPRADLAGRRQIVGALRGPLLAAFAELGDTDTTLPKTLVFEDARAAETVVTTARDRWRSAIAVPLQRVSDILPTFDITAPQRLTLKAFFLARYGRGGQCEDVLRFIHEFGEDIFDEYTRVSGRKPTYDEAGVFTGHENWLGEPGLAALNTARTRFGAAMRELWSAREGGSPEISVPESLIDEVSDLLAPVGGAVRPQGYFLQLGGSEAEPEIVVNRAMSGMSFAFSRFTHCFDDLPGDGAVGLAEQVRSAARDVLPEGAVLAELVGGLVNSNLNIHGRLTDYQLVCPAESSSFPLDDQITLDDLVIVHDPDGDRLLLHSRRLGREVVPVYLGYLIPTALPQIARTLLLFSPMGMSMLDLWGGVAEGPARDGVTTRPRVRYRNVVLSRQTWSAPAGDLPARAPGQDDAEWFLSWRRWQRRHGVPDQAFVTVPNEPDEGADGEQPTGMVRRSKPSYVDFTSVFALTVLDSHLRRTAGRVQFEEMRPTEEELYVRSTAGTHVCELAVEMTRVTISPTTQQEAAAR